MAVSRFTRGVALVTTALTAATLLVLLSYTSNPSLAPAESTELIGTWNAPKGIGIDKEPYSAPANLWLYWGSSTNRRFTGSGEHVRHVFKMGNIAGGEWRDPKFLRSLEGGLFNKLSQICCNTLLFPPMEWDFLVVNSNKVIGQNIRAFVANGNSMVLTGGILSLEFINRYFYYQLEEADGDYDAGPFLRLPHYQGLTEEQHDIMEPAPKILPQVGIEVTSVKKESLPSGSSIIYTSPFNSAVFAIKFCMADNPMSEDAAPLPPVKVLPRDCPANAAMGRPCSCGFICYLGYDWRDPYPSRWDTSMKAMVDLCSQVPPENSAPALEEDLAKEPIQQKEESKEEMVEDEAEKEKELEPKPAVEEEEEEKEEEPKAKEEEEEAPEKEEEAPAKEEEEEAPAEEEEEEEPEEKKSAAHKSDCVDCAGLASFEETGCGPLCKLEKLVHSLKSSA